MSTLAYWCLICGKSICLMKRLSQYFFILIEALIFIEALILFKFLLYLKSKSFSRPMIEFGERKNEED